MRTTMMWMIAIASGAARSAEAKTLERQDLRGQCMPKQPMLPHAATCIVRLEPRLQYRRVLDQCTGCVVELATSAPC